MAFAITIYFDSSTEALLSQLWKKFDAAELPNIKERAFRPHITLCIYREINCADCECKINEISTDFTLHEITLDHLGIFNNADSVLFLAPTPTEKLLEMQKKVFQILDDFAEGPWDMYKPGKWVPHCTLANDLNKDQLIKAIELSHQIELPIQAHIAQIGIVEFDPIQPIFEVDIEDPAE